MSSKNSGYYITLFRFNKRLYANSNMYIIRI